MLEIARNHALKRKVKQLCFFSQTCRSSSRKRILPYQKPALPVTDIKVTVADSKKIKRSDIPVMNVQSIQHEYDTEKKAASDSNFRVNEFNIQMLSSSLHKQIFPQEMPKHDRQSINSVMDELRKHNLPGVLQKLPDIDLQLPEILNHDLEQHFYDLGRQQSEPYRLLVDQLVESIPPVPKEWLFTPGWVKYVEGEEPVSVPYPEEEALVFDVEVCCKEGDNPVIATAVSKTSWYCWVSDDLYNVSKKLRKNHFYHYTTKEFVNIESPSKKSFVSKNWLEKPKIIVGHHVSFDRARIKEQYWLERTGARFLDTMSLHIAIRGVTSQQKAMLKSGNAQEESWFGYASVSNSLNEVHKYYCGEELKKEAREIFVKGELKDIKDDFQNLVSYCAMDVVATQKILIHLWPSFLERFPHPVTLAGILELATAYLPVNGNWKRYLEDSQQTFEDIVNESKFLLSQLANKNCQLVNNDRYKNNIWLWDQEWESKKLKLKKVKPLTKKQLKEKLLNDETKMNEEPREIREDYESDEFDCGKIREYENHFTKLLSESAKRLPKRCVHLIGYPEWYRKLCDPPDADDWTPGPISISTSVKSVPKLLSLTWNFMPLHRLMKYGWCFIVPFKTDIEIPEEEKAIFPYREFFQYYLNVSRNGDITFDEVDCAKIEAYLQHCASSPQENVEPEKFGLRCGLVKLPHKNGAQLNVGNPLSRDFINKFSDQELSCNNQITQKVIEMSRQTSYWKNNKSRIESQLVVWLRGSEVPYHLRDTQVGVIIPQVIPCGTLTRRAVESLWMTASNADHEKIGSELRSMIQAPAGYSLVGADVDSQELWIAGLIGDAHVIKEHGCTAFGWRTLSGQKSEGTDMHSVSAKTMGISRNNAKVINYARIYGAGLSFSERLLEQFAPGISKAEASAKARKMFETTKGKRVYRLKDDVLPEVKKRYHTRRQAKDVCERLGKDVNELFCKPQWIGGSESEMFNSLEEIASNTHPRTPFLRASLSEAVSPQSDEDGRLLPTRINWVVQSSAVDFLHLMLVCMRWLIHPKIRFCLSFHDEVRYLTPDKHRYQTALALHVTNLLVRSFFVKRLGMNDLPQSVAFFSCVEVDKVYRKDAFVDCATPSNPHGLSKGYGIPVGESLDINATIEKARGKIGAHEITRKPVK